jgi:hypothetical protein
VFHGPLLQLRQRHPKLEFTAPGAGRKAKVGQSAMDWRFSRAKENQRILRSLAID